MSNFAKLVLAAVLAVFPVTAHAFLRGAFQTCFTYPTGSPFYQSLDLTSGWSAINSTLATDVQPSPDCTTSGALLTEDASASSQHRALSNPPGTLTSGQLYTITAFAKRITGTRNFQILIFNGSQTSTLSGGFDLGTCTVNSAFSASGTWINGTDSGYVVGGYCKMAMTFTPGANDSIFSFSVLMASGNSNIYNGDGTSSIALWGVDWR